MADSATPVGAVPDGANTECVGPESDSAGKAASCAGCPNQATCAASAGKPKVADPVLAEVMARMAGIKHKLLVVSGKGGVGKSTISSQIAWALADQGYAVGILDIDICGPSIPLMMGVENEDIKKAGTGWQPVQAGKGLVELSVMSIAFMLGSRDDAVIWRGPKKTGLIKQFLTDVNWGELDFLIIDSPPGTSDEHITLTQMLKGDLIDGTIIVTTPQEVSLCAVRKEINFCKKVGLRITGVVENMAAFVCPCCAVSAPLFPAAKGGGATKMAADMGVPYLGPIPHDPHLLAACENGVSYLREGKGSAVHPFNAVIDRILSSSAALRATVSEHKAAQAEAAGETPTPTTTTTTTTTAPASTPGAPTEERKAMSASVAASTTSTTSTTSTSTSDAAGAGAGGSGTIRKIDERSVAEEEAAKKPRSS